MLFIVIEHFKNADPAPVRERFVRDGRMLPEGVVYKASWVDAAKARCFQLMEAPESATLKEWTQRWNDLVDFEIVPVVAAKEYWESYEAEE